MAGSGDVNWSAVTAIVAAVAVVQVPLLTMAGAAWRWARNVDARLSNIEARSHRRRAGDDQPLG